MPCPPASLPLVRRPLCRVSREDFDQHTYPAQIRRILTQACAHDPDTSDALEWWRLKTLIMKGGHFLAAPRQIRFTFICHSLPVTWYTAGSTNYIDLRDGRTGENTCQAWQSCKAQKGSDDQGQHRFSLHMLGENPGESGTGSSRTALQIINDTGSQVVDTWAFNANDLKVLLLNASGKAQGQQWARAKRFCLLHQKGSVYFITCTFSVPLTSGWVA